MGGDATTETGTRSGTAGAGRTRAPEPATGAGEGARTPAAAPAAAPPAAAAPVDFAALDDEYARAAIALENVMQHRQAGVRECLNALNEADAPSITDQILRTLAIAALGFGSAYVATAVGGALAGAAAAEAIKSAVSTAIEDGLKEAGTQIAARLAEGGSSKSGFFAAQESTIADLEMAGEDALVQQKRAAIQRVNAASTEQRTAALNGAVSAVSRYREALHATREGARQHQFQRSLTAWLNAQSQAQLGQTEANADGARGTRLNSEIERTPREQLRRGAAAGVIYMQLGQRVAQRPLAPPDRGPWLRVAGMTSAAHERIRNVPVRDLGLPIVVHGYLYDGSFLDGISVAFEDNAVGFSRTETGAVSVSGTSDGINCLRQAANVSSEVEAARMIIAEDLGGVTLANASLG